MVFASRIFLNPPDIVGRSPETYARELETFLRELCVWLPEGMPGGFLEIDPEPVSLSAAAVSPGTEVSGWAAANHVHWIDLLLTAKGDSLTFDGANYLREPVGADDTVLVAKASQSTGRWWRTVAQFLELILTTKGDILTRTAAGAVRKGVGADGLSLTADSAQTDGLLYGPKVLRPGQITSDLNNVDRAGASVIFINSDADRSITGIVAGTVDGEPLEIWNNGSFLITFPHQNAGSSAANRFYCQGETDIVLKPGFGMRLRYDLTAAYWRAVED